MRAHRVGTTDISVSEIGFGCWTIGGPNFSPDDGQPVGWSEIDRGDIIAGIRAGLDAGVTHFDNADVYGNGRAERLLADCLDELGVARDRVVISTKVGHHRGTARHAYEPHHIRHQCEQSLRNLRTDHIDIYYLHHDFFAPDGEPGNLPDAAETIHELRDEGKIRAIGQSAYFDDGFERSTMILRPDVFQSWAHMAADNFIRPGAVVPRLMAEHHISFVAFAPYAKGILLGKFDADNPPTFGDGDIRHQLPEFQPDVLRALEPAIDGLKSRFGDTTEALASAATRFIAAHPGVCSVIPGFRNARQAACNVRGGLDGPMIDDDVAHVRGLFENRQFSELTKR